MRKNTKHNLILIILCILFIFLVAIIIYKGQSNNPKEFINNKVISYEENNESIYPEDSGDRSGELNSEIKYDIIEYDDSIMFSGYNNTAIMYNFDEDGIFSGIEYVAFCDNENLVQYLIQQYKSQEGNGIIESVTGEGEIFTIKYELEYFSDFVGKTKEEMKEILTSEEFISKGEK